MIELVLSIVIIAIAVMSIPMMLQESAKNDRYSLLQESILAARTKMGNILSFRWDENSPDGSGSSQILRVLDVSNGDAELDRVTGSIRRVGHIFANKRRRMKDLTSATRVSDPSDTGPVDDIDDFDGNSSTVYMQNGAFGNSFDYLDQALEMNTTVSFVSDSANYASQNINFTFDTTTKAALTLANSTNIKMIELKVTTGVNAATPFIFRAFSSNIGQSRLITKDAL